MIMLSFIYYIYERTKAVKVRLDYGKALGNVICINSLTTAHCANGIVPFEINVCGS
jgi:hypothetical protein